MNRTVGRAALRSSRAKPTHQFQIHSQVRAHIGPAADLHASTNVDRDRDFH
jgi:hypothetical protein